MSIVQVPHGSQVDLKCRQGFYRLGPDSVSCSFGVWLVNIFAQSTSSLPIMSPMPFLFLKSLATGCPHPYHLQQLHHHHHGNHHFHHYDRRHSNGNLPHHGNHYGNQHLQHHGNNCHQVGASFTLLQRESLYCSRLAQWSLQVGKIKYF